MYTTSCEGGKQHSTCLAVQTLLSQVSPTCIIPKCLCSCECSGVPRISQGGLSWSCQHIRSAPADGAAQDGAAETPWHMCAPGLGTSHQPTNSPGCHPMQGWSQLRGRQAAGGPVPLNKHKSVYGITSQEWRRVGKACLLTPYSEVP